MKKRSKKFLEVAFYLSKFGADNPPVRLGVKKWNSAYQTFYEKLNDGRTISTFNNSLNNARDSFDSHIPNSIRRGWLNDDKSPSPLAKEAQTVFDELIDKNENEVWIKIKAYAKLGAKNYSQIFNDLESIQKNEKTEPLISQSKTEGGKKVKISTFYERSPSLRNKAIEIHGLECTACGFNFEEFYGIWGKGFIEVHHLIPLSEIAENEKLTNPKTDLIVLCSNCHRMIHRKKGITLTLDELKKKLQKSFK